MSQGASLSFSTQEVNCAQNKAKLADNLKYEEEEEEEEEEDVFC